MEMGLGGVDEQGGEGVAGQVETSREEVAGAGG